MSATAASSNDPNQDLCPFLECMICWDAFSCVETGKTPLLLSCGHSFCSNCITTLVSQAPPLSNPQSVSMTCVRCPACRSQVLLQQHNPNNNNLNLHLNSHNDNRNTSDILAQIPINLGIMSLLQQQPQQQQQSLTCRTNSSSPVDSCCAKHNKPFVSNTANCCYCLTCEQMVCTQCKLEDCAQHDLTNDLASVENKIVNHLTDSVRVLGETDDLISLQAQNFRALAQDVTTSSHQAATFIRSVKGRLYEAIDTWEHNVLEQVTAHHEAKSKSVDLHVDYLHMMSTCAKASKKICVELIEQHTQQQHQQKQQPVQANKLEAHKRKKITEDSHDLVQQTQHHQPRTRFIAECSPILAQANSIINQCTKLSHQQSNNRDATLPGHSSDIFLAVNTIERDLQSIIPKLQQIGGGASCVSSFDKQTVQQAIAWQQDQCVALPEGCSVQLKWGDASNLQLRLPATCHYKVMAKITSTTTAAATNQFVPVYFGKACECVVKGLEEAKSYEFSLTVEFDLDAGLITICDRVCEITTKSIPPPPFVDIDQGLTLSNDGLVVSHPNLLNDWKYAISDYLFPDLVHSVSNGTNINIQNNRIRWWKIKVLAPTHFRLLYIGIISNNQCCSRSYWSSDSYTWASENETWPHGTSVASIDWNGWHQDDEAVFKLNLTNCTLEMKHKRTNTVHSMNIRQSVEWMIHVNLFAGESSVRLEPIVGGDQF